MKAIKVLLFSVVLLTLPFFSGCKKENMCDCIKRTGQIVKETRAITGFDQIVVENNVNVFITEDSVSEVTVEAGENLVKLIKTEVDNHVLYIRNKNRCNWTRYYNKPLNVYVKVPRLKYLTSDGTGNIVSLNAITTPEIDVHTINSGDIDLTVNNNMVRSYMHGSANMTLHGHTNEHAAYIRGTAYFYAGDLTTGYTYMHSMTLGPCEINVTGILICRIDEKGDVICKGNPTTVEEYLNSSGKLIFN